MMQRGMAMYIAVNEEKVQTVGVTLSLVYSGSQACRVKAR